MITSRSRVSLVRNMTANIQNDGRRRHIEMFVSNTTNFRTRTREVQRISVLNLN